MGLGLFSLMSLFRKLFLETLLSAMWLHRLCSDLVIARSHHQEFIIMPD